jgi:tRNA modification GTPase
MTFSSSDGQGVQSPDVSLLTPPGRGALAVVGVSGRGAVEAVDRLCLPRGGPRIGERGDGTITFGTWSPTGEAVVVVRHAADRVEVHGHGGLVAAEAVIASLESSGCRRGDWSGWCAGGRTAREALVALPEAWGTKAAMILTRQAAGALDRSLVALDRLIDAGDRSGAGLLAARLLAAARVGVRLTRPWRVVLAGAVNAGKSSLMNTLLGHGRSIVSPAAGTTRDVVTAGGVLGGWWVELIDTAGERAADEIITATERAGIARAAQAGAEADLVIRVVAADQFQAHAGGAANELLVLSKADLRPDSRPCGMLATSTVTGAGIDALIAAIIDRLVPEERADPSLLDDAVPFTRQQVETISRYVASASLDLPRM